MRAQLLSAGETFCNYVLSKFSLWLTSIVLETGLLVGCGKKIEDYAEIIVHIMRKHALIMRELHRIMRKFKQFVELIIRPVQACTCLW